MKFMEMPNARYSLRFLLIGFLASCGVEVGNPTKPSPAPSLVDQDLLAMVSSEQLQETVVASAEGDDFDEESLALVVERSCEVTANGTVNYRAEKTRDSSIDLPLKNPRKRIALSTTKSNVVSLKSETPGLSCRAGGRLPNIDWKVVALFHFQRYGLWTSEGNRTDVPGIAFNCR